MTSPPTVHLADFQYHLPDDRIARYPLVERDQSKLLVFREGLITHKKFFQLPDLLPVNSTLFFNNTKVIPARLLFTKDTGGVIEVFLLNPAEPGIPIQDGLNLPSPVIWKCAIGNAKRWPTSLSLHKSLADIELRATWSDRERDLVEFHWTPAEVPFARIVEEAGAVPLPPYLNRPPEESDRDRYQTVYSKAQGAVAAPTAGLHFTPALMETLKQQGISSEFLTLHVSAGTFLPVKVVNAAEHKMHQEELILSKHNVISLLHEDRRVIAVGTTAMRTLESAYWYGVMLARDSRAEFLIPQGLPYQETNVLSKEQALNLVLRRMEEDKVEHLVGHTSLYVLPGYKFRVVQGLITNFHQPGSTLLMLIAAFVGPAWKEIYSEALATGYRFLSYGDSSLLLPDK
ncbi:MAG: S-adenosylmethionine:tRNA ribosyltransferase-isomerase [Cyclobacteriaceae bacterium]|nr:S-adenosylmethionine:tRNA ribosyltransferase-isomerase [Cyclobacteriaceae bacterium]